MDHCRDNYAWTGVRGLRLYRCHCCKTVNIVAFCRRCVQLIEDDLF